MIAHPSPVSSCKTQQCRRALMQRRVRIAFVLCLGAMALAGCGIRGDLVRPSDIPDYEKERQEKRGSLPL